MSNIRLPLSAVIFDMDGLMVDSERIVKNAWDKAGTALGYGPLGYHMPNTLGMNRKAREAYFLRQHGDDFPFDTFQTVYRDFYLEETNTNGLPLKPGLLTLLQYLKKEGYKTAVASSSSPEHIERTVCMHNIDSYFDVLVSGTSIVHSKPAPDIYLKAAELLKVSPQHAIALEDAPNGIQAAYTAGLYPIMIPDLVEPSARTSALLFRLCRSLDEIPDLIEKYFCHK